MKRGKVQLVANPFILFYFFNSLADFFLEKIGFTSFAEGKKLGGIIFCCLRLAVADLYSFFFFVFSIKMCALNGKKIYDKKKELKKVNSDFKTRCIRTLSSASYYYYYFISYRKSSSMSKRRGRRPFEDRFRSALEWASLLRSFYCM